MSSPVEQTYEDKLAIQLMECAILVKKGDRTNPVVLDSLEKLREFCFPGGRGEKKSEPPASAAAASHHGTGKAASTTSVAKPHFGGMIGKMMGLDHHDKKTTEQKAATSQKNAARVKADLAAEMNGDNSHGSSWNPFVEEGACVSPKN